MLTTPREAEENAKSAPIRTARDSRSHPPRPGSRLEGALGARLARDWGDLRNIGENQENPSQRAGSVPKRT